MKILMFVACLLLVVMPFVYVYSEWGKSQVRRKYEGRK